MKNLISAMLFLLIGNCSLFSQVLFDVESFNFNQDTIISMSVGDPDQDGKDDIFVTIHNSNLVQKLRNNGSQFTKTPYFSKEKPDIFTILSLNGEDDIVYTEKGKSTVHMMYGKDSYYTEKAYITGVDLGSSVQIKSIGDVQPATNIFSNRFLYAIDQNSTIHILPVYNGSFNSVGSELKASIPLGIPVQQACGYYFENRISRLYIPDTENGKLKALVRKWDNFQGPFFEPNMETIDENLNKPVGCLTYTSGQNGDVMFVIDKGSKSLVKYYLEEGYRKETFSINIDNPSLMSAGLIDNNESVDLIILDGNKLWLLSDLHQKGNPGALLQTLIVEEPNNIKNVRVSDVNGDGYSDIIYNLQGSNQIRVMKNDIKSSVSEPTKQLSIHPNPAQDKLDLGFQFEEIRIYTSSGVEVLRQGYSDEVNIGHLPKGVYVVKTKIANRILSETLIINQ